MIESREFATSDGTRYKVTMFGAKKGQALLTRVMRIVAPALGRAADGATPVAGDIDVMVGSAIDKLCEGLTPELIADLGAMFEEKTEYSTDDGAVWVPLKGKYDDHFAGRYAQLIQWLKGCFEVNYADFFVVFQGAATGFLASKTKAPPSGSPNTSTGTSIESRSPTTSP